MIEREVNAGESTVAEWLRRWIYNPLGAPAQVRILPVLLKVIFYEIYKSMNNH